MQACLRPAISTAASLLFVCWTPAAFAAADDTAAVAQVAGALLPSDLSPWGVFQSAGDLKIGLVGIDSDRQP